MITYRRGAVLAGLFAVTAATVMPAGAYAQLVPENITTILPPSPQQSQPPKPINRRPEGHGATAPWRVGSQTGGVGPGKPVNITTVPTPAMTGSQAPANAGAAGPGKPVNITTVLPPSPPGSQPKWIPLQSGGEWRNN